MRHEQIKTFYEAQRHKLYTYALSLTNCPATAEDAVHTAICKLLTATIMPRRLKPYAYRCIRNAAIDNWRRHAARNDRIAETDLLALADQSVQTHISHDLNVLLGRLDQDEREIIVLKTLHGFTFREIAAICECSINTIASRYRRGLQKLKDLCKEDQRERP